MIFLITRLFYLGMHINISQKSSWIDEVGALLEGSPFSCVDVQLDASAREYTVYIERSDSETASIDDCVKVNKLLEEFSDRLELGSQGAGFDFIVSTPGIDPPLRTKEHFKNFIGKNIELELENKYDGRKKAKGILVELSEQDTELLIETARGPWRAPLDLVLQAKGFSE